MKKEYFDIVDENNNITGTASRDEVHGNPALIHRAVHVLVFNSRDELYLQKRAMTKDIQPGKWDTSVGGHVGLGEDYETAGYREMEEELGIKRGKLTYLYDYPMRNEIESENVRTYKIHYDGPITLQHEEISEGRFWSMDEIKKQLGTGKFTPNFEQEFAMYFKSKEK